MMQNFSCSLEDGWHCVGGPSVNFREFLSIQIILGEEGKIKPVGTGRIFRDENSTKRAPPTSYPVVTRGSERDEFAANFAHTLNSDCEDRCVFPEQSFVFARFPCQTHSRPSSDASVGSGACGLTVTSIRSCVPPTQRDMAMASRAATSRDQGSGAAVPSELWQELVSM
jgi:hypothetical protein